MSYGVALRNGVPFTIGTIAALGVNAAGGSPPPVNALTEDDGSTILYEDDGVTALTED